LADHHSIVGNGPGGSTATLEKWRVTLGHDGKGKSASYFSPVEISLPLLREVAR